MAKILMVEDDARLASQIAEYLELQQHSVEICGDGRDASDLLKVGAFDLVMLDWDLPHRSGIEVLREYRSGGGRTPVLMLTGKDELDNIEAGLDTGADDYLVKPFAMRELAARVRALTRKAGTEYAPIISMGPLMIDTKSHRVMRDGEEIKLQPQEFALLEFLIKNRKEVFSLEALQQRLWATDSEASPHSVRVCIQRLRGKIDRPDAPSFIRTVHRVGYQIETDYEKA